MDEQRIESGKKPKILFISRAYPPVTGGIENQNFELSKALKSISDTTVIANTHGKKALPFFLPWMMLTLPFRTKSYDVILLGDGVLALLGWWLNLLAGKERQKKCYSVVHGLDLTFKNFFYQRFWVRQFLPSLDGLIAVGNETIAEGARRGIPEGKFTFIPNGFTESRRAEQTDRAHLSAILGQDISQKKVILRIGRFVPHKGVPWFLENVLPELADDVVFVAVGGRVTNTLPGDPDAFSDAEKMITEKDLGKRALLIPDISEERLQILLNTVDLVVSPNIHHEGSIEGFGLNAIEAAVHARVVLASDYQGLKDAIIDGQNGFLVEKENVSAWKTKIEEVLSEDFDRVTFGKAAQKFTRTHYDWKSIAQKYLDCITQ